MTEELSDKIKEPFVSYSRKQEELLAGSLDQLKEYHYAAREWPDRKRKLKRGLLKPMIKWMEALKELALPKNVKKYNRIKRDMMRSRNPALFSLPGFRKSFFLFFLGTLNIVRILILLAIYLGLLALAGIGIIKIVTMFRG